MQKHCRDGHKPKSSGHWKSILAWAMWARTHYHSRSTLYAASKVAALKTFSNRNSGLAPVCHICPPPLESHWREGWKVRRRQVWLGIIQPEDRGQPVADEEVLLGTEMERRRVLQLGLLYICFYSSWGTKAVYGIWYNQSREQSVQYRIGFPTCWAASFRCQMLNNKDQGNPI